MNRGGVPSLLTVKQNLAILTLAMLVSGAIAYGDDLPVFRKGMWEFVRTVQSSDPSAKPQTITNRQCSSPSDDMKKQNEMLQKVGCKFSPAKREGNTYTFTAECNVKTPEGLSLSSKSTSVITVEGDSAYTIKVQGETNGKASAENLKAKRIGDCPS